ncbi:MAG: hypothetical protein U5L09_02920 [Bacteroidales bacterium]|nr:hypothetical protein [Bacteroidales bacterium]
MKPGWIRASIHPTMTDQELEQMLHGIEVVAKDHKKLAEQYIYNKHSNEFITIKSPKIKADM